MVMKEPDGKYTLRAINSFVTSGGCDNGPNCFVNVAHFQEFIEDITGVRFRKFSSYDDM
jgi:hypothetical protein